MGKNKKLLYILLPLVLVIWGIIAWQIVDMDTSEKDIVVTSEKMPVIDYTKEKIDTFTLLPLTRDPFLGTLAIKKTKKSTKSNANKKHSPPQIQEFIQLPSIRYLGIFKNKETSKTIITILFEGHMEHLSVGQTLNLVTFVEANAKEMVVEYHKKRFIIVKTEGE